MTPALRSQVEQAHLVSLRPVRRSGSVVSATSHFPPRRMRLSLEDPVVITCSISGAIADRDQCPAIPFEMEQVMMTGSSRLKRILRGGKWDVAFSTLPHCRARRKGGRTSARAHDGAGVV